MSTEDRLRDALKAEAATIEPSDDGWARIAARTARPASRVKWFAAIGLAIATVGGGLAVNAALQDDDSTSLVVNPGPSTTTTTTTAAPAASVDYAIWPAEDMNVSYDSPTKLAETFARDWLGMTSPTVGAYRAGDTRSGEIDIYAFAGGVATTLTVREDGARGWRIFDVRSPNLELTTPKTLDEVTSPMKLTGRSVAFEGVVHMSVLVSSLNCAHSCESGYPYGGGMLGDSTFTGGGTEMTPFETSIAFNPVPHTDLARPTRAFLVLWTDSARDGRITEATVRLVRL